MRGNNTNNVGNIIRKLMRSPKLAEKMNELDALDVWKQEQAEKTAFYKIKAQSVIDYNESTQKQAQMIEAKAQEQAQTDNFAINTSGGFRDAYSKSFDIIIMPGQFSFLIIHLRLSIIYKITFI